ncbi:MAG: DUF1003 domain-containing protein [Parachlamydiales bacterium]|nr:DUF1003 domain-containing protein [Parachlamydiales bacterium]
MKEHSICQICKKSFTRKELFPLKMMRPAVVEMIQTQYPSIDLGGFICLQDLRSIHASRLEEIIRDNRGQVSDLEKKVLSSLQEQTLLAEDINRQFEKILTPGQKLADKMAHFGGSWTFLMIFVITILIWIGINSFLFWKRPFDPYPFILLNLLLSCLAAIQAPVIMMSQNRQAEKDRLQSEDDYRTNLRAELEIRHLHAKLDQLMNYTWDSFMETQRIQLDLIEVILEKKK